MSLKSIEEFKNTTLVAIDDDTLITTPYSIYPNSYFTGFNNLRALDVESRNIVLPIEVLNEHFEPIQELTYTEYSKDRDEYVTYIQAYKNKHNDYYIVVDAEISDDTGDSSVFSFKEMKITRFYFDSTILSLVENVCKDINYLYKTYKPKPSPTVSIVLSTKLGYTFKKKKVKPYQTDIQKNYNDEFVEMYDDIVDRLTNESKGVVFFHGVAGTGKTNLIRHLTTAVPNKEFVYIPVNMVPHLTDPNFISLLLDKKDLVLVLEDSEMFLKDRQSSGENSVVSMILNLSDGLMSDALGLQIICTFNADLTAIDEALTREGRLIAEHKFEKLSLDKTKVLAKEIGFEATEPMTLAQIYNHKKPAKRSKKAKKQIGFGK